MADLEKTRQIIEAKLTEMGLELYELKFIPAGKKSILRIFIDKPAGVTIDDCERVSHNISMVLDVEDFSAAPYTLEVSSPGIDRPLTRERDFVRVQGKTVTVWLQPAENLPASITGTVLWCKNAAIAIENAKGIMEIPLEHVKTGKMELQF